MPVGPQHPKRPEHPGRPAADPARPALPLAHQLRIHAQAARVDEDALAAVAAEPARVHAHGLAPLYGPGQVPRSLHAEVVGEVVQGAAGQYRERHAVAQGDLSGRVDRAVAAAHAEHRDTGRRLLQLGPHVRRFALDDLGRRQPVVQGAHPVGGARGGVRHHHQTLAVRQCRHLRAGPGRRDDLGARRYQAPYGERGARAQRRTGQDVARDVHTRVDPGERDRPGDRGHGGAPGRGLQRDAGREGRRRRGVAGGERGRDRLSLQLPDLGDRVQDGAGAADRALAEGADGQGGEGQGREACALATRPLSQAAERADPGAAGSALTDNPPIR